MGDPGSFYAALVREDEHFSSLPMHLYQSDFLIYFFFWNMSEIKYSSWDLKIKIVFFPLDITSPILSRIFFFHSCVVTVAHNQSCTTSTPRSFSPICFFTWEAPSLGEIFAVNVDNPISYYTRDSHNCILQYAIPVFCIDRNSQLLGFFHYHTNDLGTKSMYENITQNPKLKELY